jgi:hypothetical protein
MFLQNQAFHKKLGICPFLREEGCSVRNLESVLLRACSGMQAVLHKKFKIDFFYKIKFFIF